MRSFSKIFVILILLSTSKVISQTPGGKITYKGVINEKFVDSFLTEFKKKKRPMELKQRVVNTFRNAEPEEFILNFENNESYYYKKPNLNQEGYNMGSRAGVSPYYTNNDTDTIIRFSRSLGKIAHKQLDWEITSKTKNIGDYKCYQATVTEKLYSRQGHYYYRDVIAWFTPEIPLSFGPKHYKGLPGLILQIEAKEYTLTATEIKLNPSEDLKIKGLDKNDKVISQEESFNRISEMQEDRSKRRSTNR